LPDSPLPEPPAPGSNAAGANGEDAGTAALQGPDLVDENNGMYMGEMWMFPLMKDKAFDESPKYILVDPEA
jgi:hypothetical protein